jgi:hypothetical protein
MRLYRSTVLICLVLASLVPGAVFASHTSQHADLSIRVPTAAETETNMLVLVRSAPRVLITLHTRLAGQTSTLVRRTGKHGRAVFTYFVPFTTHAGTLRLTARTVVAGHVLTASSIVQVQPFVPSISISTMQMLHQVNDGWTPTAAVHVGEQVRVTATYGVGELAGNFFPSCVQGTVRVAQAGTTLLSAPIRCPAIQPSDSVPYVYVNLPVTAGFRLGPLDVTFDLSYDEGKYGIAHGSRSTSFSVVP